MRLGAPDCSSNISILAKYKQVLADAYFLITSLDYTIRRLFDRVADELTEPLSERRRRKSHPGLVACWITSTHAIKKHRG